MNSEQAASSQDFFETGIWWSAEWWLEAEYVERYGEAEIRDNIDALKRHFTQEWSQEVLRKRIAPNAIVPILGGGRGWMPFSRLMSAGRTLKLLEGAGGLSGKIADLKTEKSQSAYFELQIGARFAASGYQIGFVSESKIAKRHDIDANSNEHSFAIECKRLEQMAWERWGHELMVGLSDLISAPNIPPGLQVQIELHPDLSILRMEGEEEAFTEAIVQGLKDELTRQVDKLIEQPGEVLIPGIALVRVIPSESDGHGSLSGFPPSPHGKMRQILQNGMLRALKQLPSDRPGVIAIFCDFPPMPELLRLVFDSGIAADKQRFSTLAAVVLFPMQFFLSPMIPQLMYLNRQSQWTEAQLQELVKVFENGSTGLQLIN